jgi:hypothetical protein
MENTWATAAILLAYDQLADLVGDRHRIIANGWQAASMSALAGRVLQRAADVLDTVDFTPAALRDDLDGARRSPRLLHSAVELIDHAAGPLRPSDARVIDEGEYPDGTVVTTDRDRSRQSGSCEWRDLRTDDVHRKVTHAHDEQPR